MDKNELINLLKSKDSARKRKLFEFYQELITSSFSIPYILEKVNSDLENADLVKEYDLHYCRRHYCKKFTKKKNAIEKTESIKPKYVGDLVWTNPDEIKRPKLKSIFEET